MHWLGGRRAALFEAGVSSFDSATVVDLVSWEVLYMAGAEPDADEATVAQATDLSGNGHHATNGTEANRPTIHLTGLASAPSYLFTSTKWLDVTSPPTIGATASFFFVAGVPSGASVAWATSDASDRPTIKSQFPSNDFHFAGRVSGAIIVSAPAGASICVGYRAADFDYYARGNGTVAFDTTSGEPPAATFTKFGNRTAGNNLGWQGHIAAMGWYNGEFSLGEMQALESWASDNYGVVLP